MMINNNHILRLSNCKAQATYLEILDKINNENKSMAKLNMNRFSDEYKALYLFECLSEETKKIVKADWEKQGGISNIKQMPWWKWCLKNIDVRYTR